MKKLISLLMCLFILGSTCAFASEERTISNVNDIAALPAEADTVRITTATLYADGVNGQEVYVVACHGMDFTDFDPQNPRSITNAVKIGLSNENNQYVKTVCSAIRAAVPRGSKLVLVGHSMGGMVIQQVMAQQSIKRDYEILNALALGSPYIYTLRSKEGTLRRMVDKIDPIPFLSIAGLTTPLKGNVSVERSGYSLKTVHFVSYRQGSCWKSYDCLGVKGGNASMTLHNVVYG